MINCKKIILKSVGGGKEKVPSVRVLVDLSDFLDLKKGSISKNQLTYDIQIKLLQIIF